jgi:putative NADH-flavin reductase
MKLTILGATGRTGEHLLRQALQAGHDVTAVVRDPAKLKIREPALTVAEIDVTDPEALCTVLSGQDAAISTLGARNNKGAGIATAATKAVLRALPGTACRRFIAVSAVPVDPSPNGDPLLMRAVVTPLLRSALRAIYDDLAQMEREITADGDVDWTIVRPPRLLDKPGTGQYRTRLGGNVAKGRTLARADLAHALLTMLSGPATVRQIVGVAY